MVNFIYNLPTFFLLALICFTFLVISFMGVVLVHRFLPLKDRVETNSLIEFLNTSVGPIYAIFVGFIILSEIQNYNNAMMIEQQEATKAISIYRIATFLPSPMKQEIQTTLKKYVETVIYQEWPSFLPGVKPKHKSEVVLVALLNKIAHYKISDAMQQSILQDITKNVNALFNDNDERIAYVDVTLSSDVWFVLFLATAIFMGVQCFYGAAFYKHLSAVFVIALITGSLTYLIVALDHPFVGYYSVQPTTFIHALNFMNARLLS